MNVFRLLEKREEAIDFDPQQVQDFLNVCVVADDLNWLVPRNGNHFAIYIVWKENCSLDHPFSILELDGDEHLVRISANEAIENGTVLWNVNMNNHVARDENPNKNRKIGDVMKVNIWKMNDKLHLSWEDLTLGKFDVPKSRVRVFEAIHNNAYLILPSNFKHITVLSEDSYMHYLAAGSIDREVTCTVIGEEIDVPFRVYECGHLFCSRCFHVAPTNKDCFICRSKDENPNLIRFRAGPCPIDLCLTKNISEGVVLHPCGCHVPCQFLRSQVIQAKDQTELLDTFNYCPYEACSRKIQKFLRVYNDA